MLSHMRSVFERTIGMLRSKKGQGLVEYALILVLIAIVVMAAIKNVGQSTNNAFNKVNAGLQP